MADRPTAGELLLAVAALLDDEILALLDEPARHTARVAANLCRIVEREIRLGPDAAEHERVTVAELLGRTGELHDLNAQLSEELRHGSQEFLTQSVDALLSVVEHKLAIDKPGYAPAPPVT